jgi:hypothetical protein
MADKSLHYPKGECSPLFGDEADGDQDRYSVSIIIELCKLLRLDTV